MANLTVVGSDYGGADFLPPDGAILSGTFTNVGLFAIAPGATVKVDPGTPLAISAADIVIDGTLDATGAGFAGGPPQIGSSLNGFPGSGPGGGMGSFFGPCVHAPGGAGGSYGGKGGGGGQSLFSPPEALSGPTYGSPSGPPNMGSGGGSAGSHCGGNPLAAGAGGAGGGSVSLVSSGTLAINGLVVANGAAGADGVSNPASSGCNSSGGGGGSGGSVYLNGALSFGPSAAIRTNGGAGGAIVPSTTACGFGWAVSGAGGGGGRVRVEGCNATPLGLMSAGGGPSGADNATGHNGGLTKAPQGGSVGSIFTNISGPCVPPDDTPPVIAAIVTGTLGTNGWYTSDVAVDWTVTDDESDVTSEAGCDDLALTVNQNATTYTCTATSTGGTANESVTIKIDKTVPTVSGAVVTGTLGNGGWYTSNVTIGWTASDAGPSGQSMSSDCSNVALNTDTPGTTFTCTVTTGAGNSSDEGSLTVKRDATNPVVAYTGNLGSYTVDQTVAITCSASDAMSGLASSTCANIGGAAYTFALGANTFSASATDNAGNSASASASFTVSVTSESLCALVNAWVSKAGVANSLCVKLRNAADADARGNAKAANNIIDAFKNEVEAQANKAMTSANAAILLELAGAL